MIQKVVDYGMWAFMICVVIEITKIPINLINGFPVFFEFLNLKYSFSPDNNLFLLYWGGLIGLITALLTNTEPKTPTFGASSLNTNSEKRTPLSKSEEQKKSEREMAVKKERQFINAQIIQLSKNKFEIRIINSINDGKVKENKRYINLKEFATLQNHVNGQPIFTEEKKIIDDKLLKCILVLTGIML